MLSIFIKDGKHRNKTGWVEQEYGNEEILMERKQGCDGEKVERRWRDK